MNASPALYNELNKAWKSTCRILLGDEVGELTEYEGWLKELIPRLDKRKSSISGKEVAVASANYCENANFISLDEAKEKAIAPLSINKIKDIDSIVEAVSERWEYTGNKVLGNSKFVESSDTVADSQYLYDVTNVSNYQYACTVYNASNSKYVFGSGFAGNDEFIIGGIGLENVKRSFCSSDIAESADVWLSHNCRGCQDVMFTFNQLNKRNCIGNLELPKDKYTTTKKKLLEEIKEEMKKNKSFPHIYKWVPDTPLDKSVKIHAKSERPKADMNLVEKAFSNTFKVVLKKEPQSIISYEKWLLENTIPLKELTSPFDSKFNISIHQNYDLWSSLPKRRLVAFNEYLELANVRIPEEKITTLDSVGKWVADFCCFCEDYYSGKNSNYERSSVLADSYNVYGSYVVVKSENVGFTSWGIYSKNVYGCHVAKESQYCIKAYNSAGVTRCFEVDTCTKCTDTYFAHNCEGLNEAMFCWNTKGKRYVIGNAMIELTKYRQLKDTLIEQITDDILKNKGLKLNIYNIGCYKK